MSGSCVGRCCSRICLACVIWCELYVVLCEARVVWYVSHAARKCYMLAYNDDDNDNNENACQPGLDVCGASLSLFSRIVFSDLIGAANRQRMQSSSHLTACV